MAILRRLLWLKISHTGHIFFFLLIILCVSASYFASSGLADDSIAPDRNISMVRGEPGSPEWKILWDKARKYARNEEYAKAVTVYADLLKIKSNIEEAHWEYCKVLLKTEDFSSAAKVIGGLLEIDPNNSEYLLTGGAVAMHWKNYAAAIRYYGKVFERDPVGIYSDQALLGLATGLRNQGKKELAFTLFEQFNLRHPDDTAVLSYLAKDALELDKSDKSRKYYTKLLENQNVADEIILQAVQAFAVPGYEKRKATLWLEYLKRHPKYIPFRRELAKYYMATGEFEAALLQLKFLIDLEEDNDKYLLQAGLLCQRDLRRPDKALYFYEEYKKHHQEDQEITLRIAAIQSSLAHDFLPIVENEGGAQLWSDLAEIELNRLVIFREMTDLLEKNGQTEALIEVLSIIYENSGHEDGIALRLARQYFQKSRYRQALDYLTAVTGQHYKTKSYYRLKGEAEQRLGLEVDALASFEQGLAAAPLDMELRTYCLNLAGKIGDVSKLKSLFQQRVQQEDKRVPVDFVLIYLDLLAYNFLFQEYNEIDHWAREFFAGWPEVIIRLKMHKAASLRREGKMRQAEQLLRQLLNNEILVEAILFQLAENAAVDNDPNKAEIWYQALTKSSDQFNVKFSYDPSGCRKLLLKVELLKAEEKYGTGRDLIDTYLRESVQKKRSKELEPFLDRLAVQRIWLSFLNGDLTEAYRQCAELLEISGNDTFDPELFVLIELLNRKLAKDDSKKELKYSIYIAGNPMLTRLLPVADREIEYLEYDLAEKHLAAVLKKYPDSVVGNLMWAELMMDRGVGDRAADVLSRLMEHFPSEQYFPKKRIEVEARRGMYEQGLALMKKDNGSSRDAEELTKRLSATESIEELVSLARLLWGAKQQERALQIYRKLLTPPVFEVLDKKFRQEQINDPVLTREESFWNPMTFLLRSKPEVLEEFMDPQFLLANRGKTAGKIVSDLYAQYSWQKLISDEYMARKAIYDRNYYYAEKSYKRLVEQDSSQGMSDLATIYSKIGKFRKEAQVYEAMQNRGTTSPEMTESIERNTLQISPQNIFNVGYEEKNGRDGYVDIAKTTFGTSFSFTPDLDKDLRLFYANNHFESLDTNSSTGSNFFYAVGTYEFSKGYELVLGFGTEQLTGDSDTGYQYEIELKGQLDDYVSAYALLEKRQVYDTIAAIQQQITYQAIETGLSVETPIGLSFGGDLYHRDYNDGNAQNKFHGYSSYTIFGDSLRAAFRYDYQYLINDDDNRSNPDSDWEELGNELLYWSPSTFSEHRLSFHFQHDFLGYEQGAKKGMSFYSIDNAIGLEDNENVSFTTDFNIFLEMSPHFLLKGNFTLSKSNDFDEKGLSVSLHYRW